MIEYRGQSKYQSTLPKERLPKWIKSPLGKASEIEKVQNQLYEIYFYDLHP